MRQTSDAITGGSMESGSGAPRSQWDERVLGRCDARKRWGHWYAPTAWAVWRRAIGAPPRDGRVKSQERVDTLNGKVRAERETFPWRGLEQCPISVCAFDAVRTQARFRVVHVACRMRRLYARNNSESSYTLEVAGLKDLRVFNTRAPCIHVRTWLAQDIFEDIEHSLIGAVTDSMDVHLEAVLIEPSGQFVQRLGRCKKKPLRVGFVAVRCDECGAPGTEGTISKEFHAADCEAFVEAIIDDTRYLGAPVVIRRGTPHQVELDGQTALVGHPLEERYVTWKRIRILDGS